MITTKKEIHKFRIFFKLICLSQLLFFSQKNNSPLKNSLGFILMLFDQNLLKMSYVKKKFKRFSKEFEYFLYC